MENEAKELQMFINKVNTRGGWIDYVDAFRLINIYTNNYGVLSTDLTPEDELLIMWDKIKNLKVKDGKLQRIIPRDKICSSCNVRKDITYFTKDKRRKDGIDNKCVDCKAIYQEKYNIKKRRWKDGRK